MKNVILLILLIVSIVSSSYSVEFKEVGVINIDLPAIARSKDHVNTEFLTASNQKIGRYFTFNLEDLIIDKLKDFNKDDYNKLLFRAENDRNESIIFTYSDLDNQINKITPYFIFSKVAGRMADTVKVWDKKDKEGELDINSFQKQIDKLVQAKVYLQIKKMVKLEIDRYFKSCSIIFPEDQSVKRWINDVKIIRVFLIK